MEIHVQHKKIEKNKKNVNLVSLTFSRNVFTDAVGQYVWITIEKPIPLSQNPHGQIEIRKLTVLGYPLPEEMLREALIEEQKPIEDDVASLKMEKLELEPRGVPRKEQRVERHS